MKNTCCIYLCLLVLVYNTGRAQQTSFSDNDSVRYYWLCKLPLAYADSKRISGNANEPARNKRLLLSVSGEAAYQHFDRNAASDNLLLINSSSDVATLKLNLVYKESYPFIVAFRYNHARPFQLDDQYELNVGFDRMNFRQLLLQKVTSTIYADYKGEYDKLQKRYQQAYGLYEQRKKIEKDPVRAQRIVEDRLRKQLALPEQPSLQDISKDVVPGMLNHNNINIPGDGDVKKIRDSLLAKASDFKTKQTGELVSRKDSLEKTLDKIGDSLARLRSQLARKLDSVRSEMAEISSTDQLKRYAEKNGYDSLRKNKWLGIISKTDIRIGKFLLNNSELTVTNIFLHGASIKYGDERFVMLSGGMYDFAFRRIFNFRNDTLQRSRPSVFAVKIGKTDGKNLSAVTFYTGKKTKRGAVTDQLETVAGVGIEKKIYFSRNFSLEAEIAKSTTLRTTAGEKDKGTIRDLFGTFSGRTIGMYGLLRTFLPKTGTDAEVSYRYWGQQFQSFNASQYFNPQNNLSAKVSQPFFNRRLYVTGGLKYADFRSFGIASNIHTKTLFASAAATLRIKKLPILSLGYYPGSQLYWMDQSKLYEYFYYIFNATASHYFMAGKVPMQAVFTYNKFYNRYTDSLVSGAQSYYNLFWTFWKDRFSYSLNISRQQTEWNLLHTLEGGMGYAGRKVKLGGSIKWNLADQSVGIGYAVNGGIIIGKLGTINLIYDRSFLPDRNGSFIPVRTGQVQIIKPLKFSIWQ